MASNVVNDKGRYHTAGKGILLTAEMSFSTLFEVKLSRYLRVALVFTQFAAIMRVSLAGDRLSRTAIASWAACGQLDFVL
jgi:hypothetical protein